LNKIYCESDLVKKKVNNGKSIETVISSKLPSLLYNVVLCTIIQANTGRQKKKKKGFIISKVNQKSEIEEGQTTE